MNKSLFFLSLFSLVIFINCDGDTLGPIVSPIPVVSKLSPPSWIIGTWHDGTGYNNYIFSSDNVIFDSPSAGIKIDFKTAYASVNLTEEVENTTEYKITYSASYGTIQQSGNYQFLKITSTTLYYYITASGLTTGPLLLTKQ